MRLRDGLPCEDVVKEGENYKAHHLSGMGEAECQASPY